MMASRSTRKFNLIDCMDPTFTSHELPIISKDLQPNRETILTGEILNHGVALGKAFFYKLKKIDFGSFDRHSQKEEKEKMIQAIAKLRNNIGELLAENAIILTEESLEILDVYRLIVQDSMFEKDLLNYIEEGKTAFEATECVTRDLKKKMTSNTFWKTRFYDMQYLLRQLYRFIKEASSEKDDSPIQKVQTESEVNHTREMKKNTIVSSSTILIADYISPADLLNFYRQHRVVGLVLKDRGQTSHTAIIARSLRLPTLGNLHLPPSQIAEDSTLVIDANIGKLYLNPSSVTLSKLQQKTKDVLFSDQKTSSPYTDLSVPLRTLTKDNISIDLYINANLKEDLSILHKPFIQGVGLFRTEILFMLLENASDLTTQIEEYRDILDTAAEKKVIFRTIDMSDDKDSAVFEENFKKKYLPSLTKAPLKEAFQYSKHLALNTQMGQMLYNRHFFLRTQIQALLQARSQSKRPFDPLYIMIPMISNAVELKTYQKIIEAESSYLAAKHPSITSQVRIGMMIEVPALVPQLDSLCPILDFVSIGTNDLFQFFFATNRWDVQNSEFQDVLSPTFLKFLGQIIQKLDQYAISAHVCGEMAGNPLFAMVLLALGVRQLSLSPNAVSPVLEMIYSLPLNLLYPYLQPFRFTPYELDISSSHTYQDSVSLRNTLQAFIKKHNVKV